MNSRSRYWTRMKDLETAIIRVIQDHNSGSSCSSCANSDPCRTTRTLTEALQKPSEASEQEPST